MKIKMGIIGLGWMGTYHLRHIPQDIGVDVIAACDIDPSRVQFARQCGLEAYSDLGSFLANPEIELVLVATPNNTHKDLVIAALNAGKNVICEKPVTLASAELEEIIAVAKRTGKLFSVHHNRRWDRDFRTVQKVLADGTIGKPFFIESRVQGSNGIPGNWRVIKEAGGGMIYDWGIHLLDQLMALIDSRVVSVYAHVLKVKYADVDDNFKILLRFENGLSALAEIGTCCFQPLPRWHVSGEDGTLVVNDFSGSGTIVKGRMVELDWQPDAIYGTVAAGPTRTMAPRPEKAIERLPVPTVNSDWTAYYRNIRAVFDGNEELIVKPEQCLRVMKVVDAVFQSARDGVCVRCSI